MPAIRFAPRTQINIQRSKTYMLQTQLAMMVCQSGESPIRHANPLNISGPIPISFARDGCDADVYWQQVSELTLDCFNALVFL